MRHDATTRDAIADLVVDAVDAGTLNASGRVIIYTANRLLKLSTIILSSPAFAAAASGVAAGLGMPLSDSNAIAAGTAAVFDVVDRDENVVFSGDVDTDMTLPNTEINVDDIVKIISMNYTAPP